jgi:hypothetical protein
MNITLDFRRFSLELHGLHRLLISAPGSDPFFAIEVGTDVIEHAFPDLPAPRPWVYRGWHSGGARHLDRSPLPHLDACRLAGSMRRRCCQLV